MMKTGKFLASVAVLVGLTCSAHAQSVCASDIQTAQSTVQSQYINGMNGLASSNFSARPGTMTSMACLDRFMQGNMDIMFRPPSLNDLLTTVMNFACQTALQNNPTTATSLSGNTSLLGLIGSLAGGLNVNTGSGMQVLNLNSLLSPPSSGLNGSATLGGLYQ